MTMQKKENFRSEVLEKAEKIDLPRGRAAPRGSRGGGCVLLGEATSADWRVQQREGLGAQVGALSHNLVVEETNQENPFSFPTW